MMLLLVSSGIEKLKLQDLDVNVTGSCKVKGGHQRKTYDTGRVEKWNPYGWEKKHVINNYPWKKMSRIVGFI